MHYCPYLCVEALEVLSLFIKFEVGYLLLEVQSISHQIKKESQKEISPVGPKTNPPCILYCVHTFAKSITIRYDCG
jgi:hypothetical protein